MSVDLAAPPPLMTSDLPGIGGQIKSIPADFEVEEIPAYEPSGTGEFLYLWIEKEAMGAEYFVRQIARRLDLPVGEVGTAGLKDRQAVTRQMVSVPARAEERLKDLEGDGLRLLRVSRHGNKLKPGHLHGNRFRVLIRQTEHAGQRLPPLLDRLRSQGLANFYGPQRFGRDAETLHLGLALLRREPAGGKGKRLSPFLRKLAVSAAQAGLFNRYLAQRLEEGLLRRVIPGDVMARWPFGGLFVAEDVAAEQQRFDRRETVSAGPIFGRKTFPARDKAASREAAVLAAANLTPASFAELGKLAQGTRRHNLIYVEDLGASFEEDGVRLTFALPAGSYATVLLRELMKNETAERAEEMA